MTDLAELPVGFTRRTAGRTTVVAAAEHLAALASQGLDRAVAGLLDLEPETGGPGRGVTALIPLGGGRRARMKQMRRGGLLGPLWRDRFLSRQRLMDNLRVPLAALARGVATAKPVGLWIVSGPPGFCRAWLATEEIEGARDLTRRIASGEPPPTTGDIDEVIALVRAMHDAGIDHRDLNLGNLLLADPGRGAMRAFVVDLDRARILPRALGARARMRALRRLERSAVKLFGERPLASFDLRGRIYDAYAAGEPRWTRVTSRARRANRVSIALHRLGWSRPGAPPGPA